VRQQLAAAEDGAVTESSAAEVPLDEGIAASAVEAVATPDMADAQPDLADAGAVIQAGPDASTESIDVPETPAGVMAESPDAAAQAPAEAVGETAAETLDEAVTPTAVETEPEPEAAAPIPDDGETVAGPSPDDPASSADAEPIEAEVKA